MKLVVGLGNPGLRYAGTRHNIGFRVAEAYARRLGVELDSPRAAPRFEGAFALGSTCRPGAPTSSDADPERALRVGVLLPHTFMNRSGRSVAAAVSELPIARLESDLVVVVDDLDLPFGRLRLRPSGGSGGQRGLESLIQALDTRAFPRLRFGIGRPPAGEDPVEYVLSAFSTAQEVLLPDLVADAVDAIETVVQEGVGPAMNRFNRERDPGG